MKARTAVVTGAGRGLGASIAETLVREGFQVALLENDPTTGSATAERLPGVARFFQCDVRKRGSVESALQAVEAAFGPVSVLVNNAGVGGPFHLTSEVSEEEWDDILNTNLKSVFLFCRVLLPKMQAQGFGRIVNIASIQGLVGAVRSSTYAASKHGVIGYTRAVAAEWGPYGITCNVVCPGVVATALGVQETEVPGHAAKVLARTPVGRVAEPAEIARWVSYLVGPESGYVNGSVLTLDGGMTCSVGY